MDKRAVGSGDLIDHAHRLLALAESLGAAQAGAAGLGYQAADLSIKALLIGIDGDDIWSHEARRARVEALLGVAAVDQAFLHRVRQLDFYADVTFGGPLALPSADERAQALTIARRIVDAVDAIAR
jgi:HEPN domain-containing protein